MGVAARYARRCCCVLVRFGRFSSLPYGPKICSTAPEIFRRLQQLHVSVFDKEHGRPPDDARDDGRRRINECSRTGRDLLRRPVHAVGAGSDLWRTGAGARHFAGCRSSPGSHWVRRGATVVQRGARGSAPTRSCRRTSPACRSCSCSGARRRTRRRSRRSTASTPTPTCSRSSTTRCSTR